MGLVLFCTDTETSEAVALKFCKPELLNRFKNRLDFIKEITNWILLGLHPNIVSAYRVEQCGSPPQPYLVLEQVGQNPEKGVSLSHALRRRKGRPFSFRRALEIMLDICNGMHYANERIAGLVHRDLKPGNVLLDDSGRAKITDFGLARSWQGLDPAIWQESMSSLVDDPEFKPGGTALYCAPECWDPMRIPEARNDIYSAGLILFELVTGTKAINAEALEDVKQIHLKGELMPVPEELPECMAMIINQCTAKRPEDRFDNWEPLGRAIQDCYIQITGEKYEAIECETHAHHKIDINSGSNLRSYLAVARSYVNLGFVSHAIGYLQSGLNFARQEKNNLVTAEILHYLGVIEESQGRLPAAIQSLEEALDLAGDSNNGYVLTDVLSLLGNIYAQQGDSKKAIPMLEQAIGISKSTADRNAEGAAMGSLANALAEMGDYLAAIKIYDELIVIFDEVRDLENKVNCLFNLGLAWLAFDKPNKAATCFLNALEENKELGDFLTECRILKSLCDIQEMLGNNDSAKHYAAKYIEISDTMGGVVDNAWAKKMVNNSE